MKKLIVALALAVSAVAAPAFADSVSVEVRDFTKPEAKEVVVQGWTHAGPVLLGAPLLLGFKWDALWDLRDSAQRKRVAGALA